MIRKYTLLLLMLLVLCLPLATSSADGTIRREDIKDDAVGSDEIGDLEWLHFDPTYMHASPAEGDVWWNDDDKTLNIKTPSETIIQVGREMVLRSTNKTGVALTNGQVVYIDGAQGSRPTVALADADVIATSEVIGMVTETSIADNNTGEVTTVGLVRGVNTSTFSQGDELFLSSTAGEMVTPAPALPAHAVRVGYCIFSDASDGIILIHPEHKNSIQDAVDVDYTGIANGDALIYNSATYTWEVTSGIAASLWQEISNVLSPATAGNTVEIAQTTTTGNALKVSRNLASGSTDSPVMFIHQDNASDNLNALTVINDGTGNGIGITSGQSTAVLAICSAATGTHHGVVGVTASSDNAAYGGIFDQTRLGLYGNFEETSPPATPNSGDIRVYGKTDGLMYQKDDAGTEILLAASAVTTSHSLDAYINSPTKRQDINIHGGLVLLGDRQVISTGVPANLTTGLGKIVIVVVAGSDLVGDITITGTSVDRDTGAETPADTDTVSISGATVNNSTTDPGGNTVHDWANAYISTKWFRDGITLSTTNVNLSDFEVWHCSFEQFNDQSNVSVTTLDINAFLLDTNAELYAHLYHVNPGAGDTLILSSISDIEYTAAGSAANRYVRLRRGGIGQAVDGSSEGIFLDMFLKRFANADWEDMIMKIWYECTTPLE